ncbi:hypothetical protein AB4Y42_02425 [Paraburkholderia sp. EG286B]|uniref:hypothetical protein n=1 Tax=Paraburkholderia sp. EG286B TaxID=3237011 RepID=UPI0034D2DF06
MATVTQDTHRELLLELIQTLETEELRYYERTSSANYWAWHIFVLLALMASLLSAACVSLLPSESFQSYGKALAAGLSLLSAFSTGVLTAFKFKEKEALREEGRIELVDMIYRAKSGLIDCDTEEQCCVLCDRVREEFTRFSLKQHRGDTALRSDEATWQRTGRRK